jgi:hypothetical protein
VDSTERVKHDVNQYLGFHTVLLGTQAHVNMDMFVI